jgi:hypothetical protein
MSVRIEKQAEPIPGYKLLDRLGGGGFGEVWRCEAPGGLLKAIKFVYGDLQDMGDDGQRAEQELKALSRVKTVRHPYILSLERYDILDGQLLIVMELADKNLWDRYKECRAQALPGIPRDELLGYMEETAEALDLMNLQYGLQHLDIKPQNLFLVHNHVKVADFGLVKDLEGMRASVTGGVTPVYAAPETFDGWVSRFSDQYSLAIVYQELLTGHRPFIGNNVRQLVLQHLQGTPNLSSLAAADQALIARALAKDPDERFPTCRELIQALRRAGAPPAPPAPPAAEPPPTEAPAPTFLQPRPDLPGGEDVADPPRELIESAAKPTFCIRPRDDAATAVTPAAETVGPPVEFVGDGSLFPALVIGLGSLGLTVLRQLRALVQRRFGSSELLPNLRLLLLDIDPAALKEATQGGDGSLSQQEVFLTPLNRPAHYLKGRERQVSVESWLDAKMLYRIPRSRLTGGVRALGRLAFCDHHRGLSRRLRGELQACVEAEALQAAARQTGLGIRSNRPRVYVVAGVAGGTGGGMFLDLAYTLRAQLKQLGYAPDVVALLAVPAVDAVPAGAEAEVGASGPRHVLRTIALGNTFAALTELRHFARAGQTFRARYHENDPPLQDADPPFVRTVLLPLEEGQPDAGRELAELAGEFLARDLCSPLERALVEARAAVPNPPPAERSLFCQTFSLYQWSAPYRRLVQEATSGVCARLIQRWMSKDASPVQERVGPLVQEHWAREGWSPEALGGRLAETSEQILGKPVKEVIAELLAPAAAAAVISPAARAEAGKGRVPPPPLADAGVTAEVLQRLEAVVGWPPDEEVMGRTAQLPEALKEAVQEAVVYWGRDVGELVAGFIEQPDFRLAGAEEAVRRIIGLIERALADHEPRYKDLAAQASDVYKRLRAALAALQRQAAGGKQRHVITAADVHESLQLYARSRYQGLLLQQLIAAYVSLRGQLSDQLREINFCRVRLGELLGRFGGPPGSDADASLQETAKSSATPVQVRRLPTSLFQRARRPAQSEPEAPVAVAPGKRAGSGRCLFPNGCKTMEEAVGQYLEQVTPEVLHELDGKVQAMVQEKFTSLVQVCLASANVVENLEQSLRQEVEAFVSANSRWGAGDRGSVSELFLGLHPDPEAARAEVVAGFEAAAPELRGVRAFGAGPADVTVLLAPDHPASAAFRTLAKEALPQVELVPATGGEDLVFYREVPYLPLAGLEQLGTAGEEAYRQMLTAGHFTPHARIDIPFKGV